MHIQTVNLGVKRQGVYEPLNHSPSRDQVTLLLKKNRQTIDQYISRITQLQLQLIEEEAKLGDGLQEEKRLLAILSPEDK